jgi:ABC-2 type transport system permease protein
MATIAQTQVEEKELLQPVAASGWRRGLGNLLRKELGEWFGTKKWLIQILIWVFIINGITTMVMVAESSAGTMTNVELANEVLATFLQMLVMVVGIGLVVTVQGTIVGEKQSGTAAWVMSKPASRPAFIVAKVIANIVGFGVTAVIIPTTLFLLETWLVVPLPVDIIPFLSGLAVVALSLLFYLMLALMLGTIYNNRGPITGIGIGLLLAGLFISGMVPQVIQLVTPWLLSDVAVGLALQQPLPDIWFVPLVVNGFWIVIFTAVALWRFSREEF